LLKLFLTVEFYDVRCADFTVTGALRSMNLIAMMMMMTMINDAKFAE